MTPPGEARIPDLSAWRIRVVEGGDEGLTVPITKPTVFGCKDADVVLADQAVSGRHLRITISEDGLTVEDLPASTGTFINGARLGPSQTLNRGDTVRLGTTVMKVLAPVTSDATRMRPTAEPLTGGLGATRMRPTVQPDTESFDLTRQRPTAQPDTESLDLTRQRPAAHPQRSGAVSTAPPDEPRWELRFVRGPDDGLVVPLARTVVIGRDPECDVIITDEEASRRHLQVSIADGEAFITDLKSTNGTYLNGTRIIYRQTLKTGDMIEVGRTAIEFATPGAAPAAPPEPPPSEGTVLRRMVAQPSKMLDAQPSSRKWWTLLVVSGAVFMLILDSTIVAVALPSISHDLKTSFTQLQWVVDAYTLMLAAVLLTAGSLSDIVGRRVVFVVGLVVFTVTSAICGVTTSGTILDFARGLQGFGGALMLATSLALLAQEFTPAERGVAFGIWGLATGAASALGPLAGGVLTQGISWRAVFYVNVPVGVILLFLTLTRLVNLKGAGRAVDWAGSILFPAAAFMLVFALIRGNDEGWTSPLIVSMIAGAVVLLAAFLFIESRREAAMLQLSLFRNPTFVGAALAAFALAASVMSLIIYISLWLQSIRGFGPLGVGIRLLPFSLLAFLSPLGGRLYHRFPPRTFITVGLLLIGAGDLQMHGVGSASPWTFLLPGFLLCGAGMGAMSAPLSSTAIGVVPPWSSGMASGINSTFRQLGMATGIAALGSIFQDTIRTHVVQALATTPLAKQSTNIANAIAAGGAQGVVARTPPGSREAVRRVAAMSLSAGLSDIFAVASVLAFAAGIATLLLIRRKDLFKMPTEPPSGGPPGGGPPGGGPPGGGPPGGGPPGGGPPGGGPPGGGPPGGGPPGPPGGRS